MVLSYAAQIFFTVALIENNNQPLKANAYLQYGYFCISGTIAAGTLAGIFVICGVGNG